MPSHNQQAAPQPVASGTATIDRLPQMPAEIRIVHGADGAKAALKCRVEEAGAGRVLVPGATTDPGRLVHGLKYAIPRNAADLRL